MAKSLEQLISEVPEGWEWLLRNTEDGRFFANVLAPGNQHYVLFDTEAGRAVSHSTKPRYPRYADTPRQALSEAIDAALIGISVGLGDVIVSVPPWGLSDGKGSV